MGDVGQDAGPPAPRVGPREAAPAPGWVLALIPVTGIIVVIGFAIAAPAHLGYANAEASFATDCGSALSPVLQSSGGVGGCNEALLAPRIIAALLAGVAAIGASLGVRHSGSEGRIHNRERDMCLVIAAAALFLLAWVAFAFLAAQVMTYDSS